MIEKEVKQLLIQKHQLPRATTMHKGSFPNSGREDTTMTAGQGQRAGGESNQRCSDMSGRKAEQGMDRSASDAKMTTFEHFPERVDRGRPRAAALCTT